MQTERGAILRANTDTAVNTKTRQHTSGEDGLRSNKEVAAELGIWPQTVTKWRKRFLDKRIEGLGNEPRPGAPRTITDERVEAVLVATLERQPAGRGRR
jgi:transposase